eukprot:Lithocolla_globosa_v1_NODE_2362_length_2034_cov_2.379990.p2 type:complete len:100 gc:universal NODE_2362_length_2034_cov_2.379990:1256-957(-)
MVAIVKNPVLNLLVLLRSFKQCECFSFLRITCNLSGPFFQPSFILGIYSSEKAKMEMLLLLNRNILLLSRLSWVFPQTHLITFSLIKLWSNVTKLLFYL